MATYAVALDISMLERSKPERSISTTSPAGVGVAAAVMLSVESSAAVKLVENFMFTETSEEGNRLDST